MEVNAAIEAQRSQEVGLDSLKPSKMNRLQRSLVSGRVSAVAKDSTVQAAKFLTWTLDAFKQYLEQNVQVREGWKVGTFSPTKPFPPADLDCRPRRDF
jgi:midasin